MTNVSSATAAISRGRGRKGASSRRATELSADAGGYPGVADMASPCRQLDGGVSAATCLSCGVRLGVRNRSGWCKRCLPAVMAADPQIRANQRVGVQRWLADPVNRAERVARCVENGRNITEEQRQARREHGRRQIASLAAAAARITPEARASAGRKRTETVLAWCPPEWRDRYRELKLRGHRAAAAKQIVLDMIAGKPAPVKWAQQRNYLAWCPEEYRDEYRSLAKALRAGPARAAIEELIAKDRRLRPAPTPFERQLERVRAGARLVARPVIRRAEHAMTLGGVASGML